MGEFIATTGTKKVTAMRKRLRGIQGGTSASKTISVILNLIDLSQTDESPKVSSVVSETFPHLRKGAMRDFLLIMRNHSYYEENRWDRTNSTYTFETGSIIEFFSADQSGKVAGPRRDRLFVNEANNISLEVFDQLEVRTNDFVFLDWNPTIEFWWHTEIMVNRNDWEMIILTYKDNEALNENVVRSIEARQYKKSWWRVYGEGQLGVVTGRIFSDWAIIDEVPHEAQLISYGLDFGYTNDPSSIVAIYYYNGGYIVDEITYGHGLSNKQLADFLLAEPVAMVVADSAEPKSIAEIKGYKVPILPATKGKGSVMQRIAFVQAQRMSVTKASVNVINEYRKYLWDTDRDGKSLNIPEHEYSHSMDAICYGLSHKMIRDSRESNDAYKRAASWEQPKAPKFGLFNGQEEKKGILGTINKFPPRI